MPGGGNKPAAGIQDLKKGEQTMLVKAKWNVKDAAGWHDAGEVFNTESDLGDAVEILDATKKEPVKEPEAKAAEEPAKEQVKPRSASRRKASK